MNVKLKYGEVWKDVNSFYSIFNFKLRILNFNLLIVFSFFSRLVFGQFTPAMPSIQSGTTLSNPFGGTATPYSDLRYQYILLTSDLTTGGLVANDVLKSIGISVSGGSTKTYGGLTISLKHTTAATLSAFDGTTGLTQVYYGNPFVNNTPGWKDFSFTSGFTWNGTNNILISFCWDNISTSFGALADFNATGSNRAYLRQATSGAGCTLSTTATTSQNVPRTRFGIQPKITSFTPTSVCASSNQTVTITGKYFTGATSVLIGGTGALSFIVNSDTQITATVGAGTTGNISVTTLQGTGTSASFITVKPRPNATAFPNTQSICSGNSIGINLTSNVTGTTFSWLTSSNTSITGESTTAQSGSSITDNLTNTTTAPITIIYTVTPTASGCSGPVISVPVTIKPNPIATSTPSSQSVCSGSTTSVSLTSNLSGTTFSWLTASNGSITGESSSAQSSSIINNSLTNTTNTPITLNYTVTLTATGCAGTAITVPITVNPIPIGTANPSNQTLCSGSASNVSLTSNVSGTTFTWLTASNSSVTGESTTDQNDSIINNTLTSDTTSPITLNYTATPSAWGCTGTAITVPITVNPNPIATANPSIQTICSGILTEISFTSNISGTTFSWSTAANANVGGESSTVQTGAGITDSLTNSTATPITLNYSVTPTLAGCSGTIISVPLTINPSVASISALGPTTFCEGSSVLLIANSGTGLTYQWKLNNSPISGQNNSTLAVNSSGNYSVSVLNNYDCSSNSNTIQLIVNTNPSTPFVSANSPTIFCQGDSVVLNVSNNPLLSYQWQNNGINILNATNNQLTVYNSGNYTILATNSNNCSAGSSIETVTVNQLPPSYISALGATTFCQGDSVVLQGDYIVNVIYNWSNQNGLIANSDSSSWTVFESGTYSYQIIDSNNCSNQSEIIDVDVNTHNPSEIYTTSLGPYSLNGTTYSESGSYIQNLQTVNGCDSVLTLNLEIENVSIIIEMSRECSIIIYPNPSKENSVYFNKSESCEIEIESIFDMYGRQIPFIQDTSKVQLLTEVKGVYYLMLNQNNNTIRHKIVLD